MRRGLKPPAERMLRHSNSMALVIAAALAQIGEFSFILVTMGEELDILDPDAQSLVLAGAKSLTQQRCCVNCETPLG